MQWLLIVLATEVAEWNGAVSLVIGFRVGPGDSVQAASRKSYSFILLPYYQISFFLVEGGTEFADRMVWREVHVYIIFFVFACIIYAGLVFSWMLRCCSVILFTLGGVVIARYGLLRFRYGCQDVGHQAYHHICKLVYFLRFHYTFLVRASVESEHVSPASPPDERPWCGECDNFIESNQEFSYCGIPSCRWVLHHNCVRPHYSRRHPFQPIPDGFEM